MDFCINWGRRVKFQAKTSENRQCADVRSSKNSVNAPRRLNQQESIIHFITANGASPFHQAVACSGWGTLMRRKISFIMLIYWAFQAFIGHKAVKYFIINSLLNLMLITNKAKSCYCKENCFRDALIRIGLVAEDNPHRSRNKQHGTRRPKASLVLCLDVVQINSIPLKLSANFYLMKFHTRLAE